MSGRPGPDEARLRALVLRVVHAPAPSPERTRAAGEVLDFLVAARALQDWAAAAPAGGRTLVGADELQQIIALSLFQRLLELTPAQALSVGRWRGWLYWKARQAARDALQSAAYTVASGMSTLLRRYSRIQATTELLHTQLHRAPTVPEVIAAVNQGDPDQARRGGLVVTDRDFRGLHLPVALDAPLDVGDPGGSPTVADMLLPAADDPAAIIADQDASARIAATVLHLARAQLDAGPDALQVADCWLAALRDGRREPDAEDLMHLLGWTRSRSRTGLIEWSGLLLRMRQRGVLAPLRQPVD